MIARCENEPGARETFQRFVQALEKEARLLVLLPLRGLRDVPGRDNQIGPPAQAAPFRLIAHGPPMRRPNSSKLLPADRF